MEHIYKYFPDLPDQQIRQFSMMGHLYNEYNQKVNLISRKDIDSLYLKHILHSLAISRIIRFEKGTRILDVGTGGGFPGLPLAIMFPACSFFLNDSIGKKIKAVNDIVRELGLKNTQTINCRAEKINDRFDFIVSRAVTSFPTFYSWVQSKVSPLHKNHLKNGILYLKGGDISDEIKDFENRIILYPIKSFFFDEFFKTKLVVYLPFD